VARLRGRTEEHAHGPLRYAELVRRDRVEVDAGERDVLLEAPERQQPVHPHAAGAEDLRVDRVRVKDRRAREPVDAHVRVLVVADDEAGDAEAPRSHGGRARCAEQGVAAARLGEEAREVARPGGQRGQLAGLSTSDPRPEDVRLDPCVLQQREGAPVVAGRDHRLDARGRERGAKREQVLDLGRIVDVDPEPHRDAA